MAKFANKLRAVCSLICLDLPSTDENSDFEHNEFQVHKRTRIESANTQSHARTTLMGLPIELRLIIYQFALQDVVDSIIQESICKERRLTSYRFALQDVTDSSVHARPSPSSIPLRRSFIRASQYPPRLGGLALPMISRTIRKESLDVYGPMLKAHQQSLWDHYIGLQKIAEQVSLAKQNLLLDAEVSAYLHWRTIGCLQRVINCMYVNDCDVRGYHGELHTEARVSE